MKRVFVLFAALILLMPSARAFVGVESLISSLIVPAISSVMNSVQKTAFSITDFAAIFSDAEPFIERNADKLALDIARGQGEYLDALAELLEVPQDLRGAWYKELKAGYAAATKTTKG